MHRKEAHFIWRSSVVVAEQEQQRTGDRRAPQQRPCPPPRAKALVGAGKEKRSLLKGHVASSLSSSPFSFRFFPARPMAAQQQATSVLQSFPFRAALLALCIALLPLVPTQAPEAVAAAGAGQAFVAKAWELLHLLVVGIAVSYGLFSRKNDNSAHDHDARGAAAAPKKDDDAGKPADARYVSRMFRDSLAPFDDDDDETMPDSPGGGREDEGGGGEVARSWSAMHRHDKAVVVVTDAETLSLPVRMLKPQPARRGSHEPVVARGRDETVLPSPIPWRSRSGRFDAGQHASPSPSRSPKRLSPASSTSRETLAKATEEYYSKRRSPHRSSTTVSSSPPPAPPPPPPSFLVHGYHPAAERRTVAAKSFKEELQDHNSKRGSRGGDRYSPNTTSFVNTSAYNTSSNSSPLKPRSSFDGGSSSSSTSVGKSVRTFRAREAPVFQGPSPEIPEEDVGGGGDAAAQEVLHGSEEAYEYRAYQSIPRFQYERSVTDPILGGVTVSSDETESSDDDDEEVVGGGAYSTRESTPEVDENEVDKKAEEFIARFREQIRRQRIESIKRSAGPRGVKHGK